MKRRFADARGNRDILEKKYINYYINSKNFVGNISVLEIIKVKNKYIVDIEQRCILDSNYTWIEIYPDNENYCITAMLDENKVIKEWYFDICKKIGLEAGVPYEDDLYLDVVIVPDGRIHVLDEDELLQAYNNKEISKEEYELAYTVKDKIINEFANNIAKLIELTNYKNYIE